MYLFLLFLNCNCNAKIRFRKLLYCYIVTLGLPSSDHRNLNGIETDLRNYGITDLRIYGGITFGWLKI